MFDTKQMTEMAEKFSDLYKNTGMKPEAFTEAFQKNDTSFTSQSNF